MFLGSCFSCLTCSSGKYPHRRQITFHIKKLHGSQLTVHTSLSASDFTLLKNSGVIPIYDAICFCGRVLMSVG